MEQAFELFPVDEIVGEVFKLPEMLDRFAKFVDRGSMQGSL